MFRAQSIRTHIQSVSVRTQVTFRFVPFQTFSDDQIVMNSWVQVSEESGW